MFSIPPCSLAQDIQEAQWLSKKGAPEWLGFINKWTCKWDAICGAQRTQETEDGLTFAKPLLTVVLANAARR